MFDDDDDDDDISTNGELESYFKSDIDKKKENKGYRKTHSIINSDREVNIQKKKKIHIHIQPQPQPQPQLQIDIVSNTNHQLITTNI